MVLNVLRSLILPSRSACQTHTHTPARTRTHRHTHTHTHAHTLTHRTSTRTYTHTCTRTHTQRRFSWTAGCRQAGETGEAVEAGKERGRMESGGGSKGRMGGRKWRERGSGEVRECREREWREGVRVEGGWVEEWNERGRDGKREGGSARRREETSKGAGEKENSRMRSTLVSIIIVRCHQVGCHDPPWLTILSQSRAVFVSHSRLFCDICHPLRFWPTCAHWRGNLLLWTLQYQPVCVVRPTSDHVTKVGHFSFLYCWN